MASMRDIKRRRASIQSTSQITKAMKLVSTVKLQKSRARAEGAKPYSELMYETIQDVASLGHTEHRYLKAREGNKKAVIAISSNRGLAGGYNSGIIKLISQNPDLPAESTEIYAVGRKGRDGLVRRGYHVAADASDVIETPEFKDAMELSRMLTEAFEAGEADEVYLAYTSFKNTVVHTPKLLRLLPLSVETKEVTGARAVMCYAPGEEEVLDELIPKYMTSLIYGALLEAAASENGARMTAMDSATSNAEEMLEKLELQYNRARQGSITQELTEIIAGSNAIS